MRYLDYREQRVHGTSERPFAFYRVGPSHPRYNMMEHWHAEYELIRVAAGRLCLTLDGKRHEGAPGDVFVVHEGVLHGGIPQSCEYECLVFDLGKMLEANSACQKAMQPVLHGACHVREHFGPAYPEMQNSAAQIMGHAAAAAGAGDILLMYGALYSFLGQCVNGHLTQTSGHGQTGEGQRLAVFKDALRLIRRHYAEPLTLDDLAAAAHMNKRYFCRFFRQMTQKTPIEYLNYYRIECACEQMRLFGKTVSEAGFACGFNDMSYFTRVFKRFKGVTPSQYVQINV